MLEVFVLNIRSMTDNTSPQCHNSWTCEFTGQVWVFVTSVSSRERTHGQRVLLVYDVQLVGAHSVSDELQLFGECLAAVRHTDIWYVGSSDVIALGAFSGITRAKPVALSLKGE